ncbi:ATPase, T2SS/T4P/T4SS family [uncultured Ilyobacter sp.]|jgi:type IV pilus assembly protein PilB|uniref:GspE/PulE family protein n=1 Tax=uncultured Ilyobacter sp. TaxID=544433 RepID=UPI0029C06770|nr:ATPase, T2SS/T4P/T4SS family [uncultured Ilyobacter sp.]
MARIIKKRLGDTLVDEKIITEDELKKALEKQSTTHKKLGETLVDMGYVSSEEIVRILGEQMGIPYVSLERLVITKEAILLLSKETAEKFCVMPLFKNDNVLHVAMEDPLDVFAIDRIEEESGMEVFQSIARRDDVVRAIEKYYSPVFLKEDSSYLKERRNFERTDTSAVEVVNLVMKKAIIENASDIHIEPEANILRVRFRIDGLLHEILTPPKSLHSAIVSRIKIISKLDIAEKRIPQDGRVEINFEEKLIDMRVSILPTIFGEKVVIRLLDKSNVKVSLESLGFEKNNVEKLKKLIRRPNGIIFVTGPTGSGKTSTLYASLNEINTLDKNIITLEDPVEYQMEIINQVQVNSQVGLDFSSGLRSILRQDPDVIMIGEIRDVKTAEIAIESAMTGHLVFSTLHTNSATGAISRLIDMGVEPFLLSASLAGVLGQRLVRKLCTHCKEEILVSGTELKEFDTNPTEDYKLYKAKGCSFCRNTGYSGRTAVIELLEVESEIRTMINKGADIFQIKDAAIRKGMKTIKQEGFEKALEGITSIEEVLRVAQDDI